MEVSVEVTDEGVTRRAVDEMEFVAWPDLRSVTIRTTDQGPFVDDVFWLLERRDGTVVAVPSEAAGEPALLERLQQLPGFDNEAVIRASMSIENAVFHCWP